MNTRRVLSFALLSTCALLRCPLLPAQGTEPYRVLGGRLQRITDNAGVRSDAAGGLRGGGARFEVAFAADGVCLEPLLGGAGSAGRHVRLEPTLVRRGTDVVLEVAPMTPALDDGGEHHVVRYERATGIDERYEVRPDGVALSWRFAERPAGSGDLVVHYELETDLPAAKRCGDGLELAADGLGGVTIGGVTGIDATGAQVAGEVRSVERGLDLMLPAAFVDDAVYPIVLDPLLGLKIDIDVTGNVDSDPDAAYDRGTDRYLVAWQRTIGSNVVVRAQLIDGNGQPVGPTIYLSSGGVTSPPRVAAVATQGTFGVVWSQSYGGQNAVIFTTVDPLTGNYHTYFVASTTVTGLTLEHADVGAELLAPAGSNGGFVIVWEDNVFDTIRARRFRFAGGQLVTSSAWDVFTDTAGPIGTTYTEPAISRRAGPDGRLLVVARRASGLGPLVSVQAAVVHSDSASVGPTAMLPGSSTAIIRSPAVDGYGNEWLVAWQQSANAVSPAGVHRQTVQLDAAGSNLQPGLVRVLGGSSSLQASAPTLGYTPGRTWLGYLGQVGLPTLARTLRAAAIDSHSGTAGTETFTESLATYDDRIVVATEFSGSPDDGEDGLAVFGEAGDIFGQMLRNYGTSGGYTNLGGACGIGGAQSFSHLPGIGSSNLVCRVNSLPPGAWVTVFNISPPSGGAACGPCVWTPFAITYAPPIVAGGASVAFPIPCLPSFVGAQVETQWTTIDPTQAPCSLFPGFVISERMLMTIGN